eukprot:5005264-Pleurochrysis_carterae.AAC.6
MGNVVSDLLHVGDLNVDKQCHKQSIRRHLDDYTADKVTNFYKGMGAKLNMTRNKDGSIQGRQVVQGCDALWHDPRQSRVFQRIRCLASEPRLPHWRVQTTHSKQDLAICRLTMLHPVYAPLPHS